MNLVQKIKGFSRYEIDMSDFSDVKVFSVNYRRTGCRKQLMPGNPNNHLMFNLLNDEGKFIIIYLHQLVWRQFNGDIPKGFDVHHINFNPSDNRPENLVLLSHSEHIKLHAKIKNEAGNFGAMKKKCLQFDKKGKFISEFESTIEAFRITGIAQSSICKCCQHKKSFNSAGGFIWIYKSKYQKLIRENKWEDFKKNYFKDARTPVVALDKEGNFISEFESIKEASMVTGIAQSSICKCCQHKKSFNSAGGFIWIYKSKYQKLIRENKWEDFKKNYFKDARTPVVALDKEGNLVAEYKSTQEAFKATGIAQSSICKCCQHKPGHYSAGGFIWIYKDEYLNTQTQRDK